VTKLKGKNDFLAGLDVCHKIDGLSDMSLTPYNDANKLESKFLENGCIMPTKHIDNESWDIIEAKTVEAIGLSGKLVKEVDIIRLLVEKGAAVVTREELRNINGFKPRYGVMCWEQSGTIKDFGTISPENFAGLLIKQQPFMVCVYGGVCSGKSSFVEKLLECLPQEITDNLTVEDEHWHQRPDQYKSQLFDAFFKDGKSVIFVQHGYSIGNILAQLIGILAKCEIDFVFEGKTGSGKTCLINNDHFLSRF